MGVKFTPKKLFGPFNGLNDSQSAFLRELPPAPNAAPREFATEFQNLVIDQKTQELLSRNGIEWIDKGTADTAFAQSRATSGLFKWIDYDAVTGAPRERAVQLDIDELGVPTVHAYRLIKTEVRLSSNTLNGKKFGIIEDIDASYAKRFVTYNSDGSVYASSTTLAGVANVTINYVDWDTDRDGAILAAGVDLLEPVTLTYSASNGTPTSVAQFYSIAKKSTINASLFLTSWLNTLDDESGAYFTAAQASNVIYFSGGGVCPVLKYDGQAIYKAGMPHAAIKGEMDVSGATANSFESTYNETIDTIYEGLMQNTTALGGTFLGRFIWTQTYERGDAKNNYIEGESYLPGSYSGEDSSGSPVLGVTIKPKYKSVTGTYKVAGVTSGKVYRYSPNSLRETDGFDARGALLLSDSATYAQSGTTTVTVTKTAHNWAVGDKLFIQVLTGTAASGIYVSIAAVTTDTFTYVSTTSVTDTGTLKVIRSYETADIGSADFTIPVDSSNNTLLAGDIVAIRADLFPDSVTSVQSAGFPVIITARLSARTTTLLTIDYDYPISIEAVPGGSTRANALDGFLSNLTTDTQQAMLASLTSLTTWTALGAWDWLGYSGAATRCAISASYCISNNLRINIYRNKANTLEGNSYSATANDGTFVPALYLVNILPNNPFQAETSMGPHFDNCKDSCLGAQLDLKNPLVVADKGTKKFTGYDYSPLPKGKAISSFKGRVYITDDVENENIIWRNDLLYGPEWFSASDVLNVETPAGDKPSIAIGNDTQVFVLKNNSVKSIISDLSDVNIRVDDLVVGEFGCVSARSAVQLKGGIAYLSSKGPVFLEANKGITYLGENSNGISRIRNSLNDSTLDLSRATACVDTLRSLYILYIPTITKPSAGIFNPASVRHSDAPYYTDQGSTFVYDYMNDAWMTYTGINAKGGMVELEGRMFYLTAYAKNTSESVSGLEWVLYKERSYGNLWNFADNIERSGTGEFRAINKVYTTDWLALDDPNMLKKFLRFKIYGIRTFSDVTVKGTSGTSHACTGSYDLTVASYKDWRGDSVQSSSTVSLTSTNLFDSMKCRNNKSGVMKFKVSHNVLRQSPKIQAMEAEAAAPFEAAVGGWSTP